MSTKTGTAPRRATALAVELNVKEGRITSSPGPIPARIIIISRAAVPEGTRMAFLHPVLSSSHLAHFLENAPSPAKRLPPSTLEM